MARKKPAIGECVYCGTEALLTVDHVPPKGLFAKSNRGDLVRVPSCRPCNVNASKDDEYLRLVLAMREDVTEIADAREAWMASLRGLALPEKSRWLATIKRNITYKDRFHEGLYLGRASAYNVDLTRLCGSMERIVKGLYWSEFGCRVPDGYTVVTYTLDSFDLTDLHALIWLNGAADAALSGRLREIGGQVFQFAVIRDSTDAGVSMWLIRIYRRVYFFAVTKPKRNSNIKAAA